MLEYIRGRITMHFDGGLVVETGGIGYRVFVPDNSSLYLRTEHEETLVHVAMIVREDDISLFGFQDRAALELFQQLRTVNGVGARVALAILSALPADAIRKAILFEDAVTLTRANGIGKKTAQRIVLELKDKVAAGDLPAAVESGVAGGGGKAEAIDALVNLGFSRTEAALAVASAEGDDLTTEDYIRRALRGSVPK